MEFNKLPLHCGFEVRDARLKLAVRVVDGRERAPL
jgi:hypothetical protein